MKFHPQSITCNCGGYSSEIITEDIPTKKIEVLQPTGARPLRLRAHIECPACSVTTCPHPGHFDIEFEPILRQGPETLFQSISSNPRLEMWRLVENGRALPPSYHPGIRSGLERKLDIQSEEIADAVFKWKGAGQAGDDLIQLLRYAEDYTQSESWKKFIERHFIVAVSIVDKPGVLAKEHPGYNGIYSTVPNKNAQLSSAFLSRLGNIEEEFPKLFCHNRIGHCAEVHSANKSLNAEPSAGLSDLKFSIAYNCRTKRPRSYCLNCITLFNLNNA